MGSRKYLVEGWDRREQRETAPENPKVAGMMRILYLCLVLCSPANEMRCLFPFSPFSLYIGVRLNKPYSVRVPMDIPVFTGTHADFLIIVSSFCCLTSKTVTKLLY